MPEIVRKHLDRRTVDRYLEKGLLKDETFQTYLKNLPDESVNAQWVQMDLHDAEISGEDSMPDGQDAEDA